MSRSDFLFSEGDLLATIDGIRRKLAEAIGGLAPSQLLASDIAQVCAHFVGEFKLTPIVILRESIELIDPVEVEVERNSDFGGRFVRKELEFRFEIPFEGDASLFRLQPSTFTLNPPRGRIERERLVFCHRRADRDGEAIKRALDEFLSSVSQSVSWQRPQIDSWNQALPGLVQQLVSSRRDKLIADRKLVDNLGFKVRRHGDVLSTIAVPIHRKAIVPQLPPAKSGPLAIPEPELEMQIYEEILDTLAGMSVVLERNPSAFSNIDEESLRTQFLIPLNSKFQGQASGETFHASGKTDILIKHNDRVLFIAECKFWKGAQSLLDAVSQLLGYVTWRETKTAILLFNRNRDFSAVLAQIPTTVAQHPQFLRNESYGSSTGFRFTVRSLNDASRHLIVTVLAFDVPPAN